MKFKERIKDELKATDYTQKEIAEHLNIDPANITNWKTGKNVPSIETLFELCKLLNISADYLLGLDEFINHNYNRENKPKIKNDIRDNHGNIIFNQH